MDSQVVTPGPYLLLWTLILSPWSGGGGCTTHAKLLPTGLARLWSTPAMFVELPVISAPTGETYPCPMIFDAYFEPFGGRKEEGPPPPPPLPHGEAWQQAVPTPACCM